MPKIALKVSRDVIVSLIKKISLFIPLPSVISLTYVLIGLNKRNLVNEINESMEDHKFEWNLENICHIFTPTQKRRCESIT